MIRNRIRAVYAATSLSMSLLAVNPAHAQTGVPPDSLKGVLLDLGVQGDDPFVLEQVAAFANLIALEVSTAPLGTSTGSFTYTFDSQLGTFQRAARSFGPAFAQRSLTIGKGKFGAGFNWVHAGYDSFAGQNLRNGVLRVAKDMQLVGRPLSYNTLTMNLSSDSVVAFASVGLTEDLDVAIAVPWISISLDAHVGVFDSAGSNLRNIVEPTHSASGVGDIAILGKYHLWHHNDGGFAGQIELRLPTGDTNNLRGLGTTRTLVSAIWSQGGTLSPHANVGFEVWSDAASIAPSRDVATKNEFKYAAGVELVPHPRVTAVVDLVGRRLLQGGALGYQTFVVPGVGSSQQLVGLPRGISIISLAPGIKWNVTGDVLITANVLCSLVNKGLRANVMPAFGLDWAF